MEIMKIYIAVAVISFKYGELSVSFGKYSTFSFSNSLGAIHKGRPHPRGEGGGVSQKRTHADARGRGGQRQNADVLKIQIFTKIFEVYFVYCVLKDNIRLYDQSSIRSLRFLNRLLLDITVIDLISIVHVDKIWAGIAGTNLSLGKES